MDTIPVSVCAVADPDLAASGLTIGRKVGTQVEVSLSAVADLVGDERAARLRDYWGSCVAFWDAIQRGQLNEAWVLVCRRLIDVAQVSSGRNRADLVDHQAALARLAPIDELVDAALEAQPEWQRLSARAPLMGARIRSSDGRHDITWSDSSPRPWPLELGGPRGPGEVRRQLRLEIVHAPWRDRRVRRLSRVVVAAEELYPCPERTQ